MASEKVILSWNATNWITVVLMAVTGWAIYRFIVKAIAARKAAME